MALLCAMMLSVGTAKAAEPTSVDTTKTYELQNVQVLSTRANQKTPVAYSELSRDDIKAVNYGKDVPSLLGMQPSVTTSSDAGTGIGYTGIHIRGTDPTRINITTNGIPMNDAESSQLYWVNLGDVASSMQSIQVQRGVGTSTNGAGAFGATVNMQTENIGAQPFTSFDLSAGSYGTHKETARFSTGLLGEHWGLQGRLSNIGSDGYIDRASARLNSYFLQGGYFSDNTVVKLITFAGKEKTYHAWDYASKDAMEQYGRTYNPTGAYTDANGQTAYYRNQTDNYMQQNYQLIWNQRLGNLFNLNAALHYTHGDGYYEQYKESQKLYKYLLESEIGSKSDLVRQKKMKNDFYGTVLSLNFDNKNGLAATLGGGWNKYDGDHFGRVIWVRQFSGALNPDHEYYRNNAKKTDANIYGKATYELLPGLNAYLDLQFRHVDYTMSGTSQEFDDNHLQRPLTLDRTYNFFNPKAGLVYRFLPEHTVYLSYAIAHKEPVRNDFENMMANSEELDPQAERLNDLEVGYKYITPRLQLGANFYYMAYDNQFVLTGAQDANGEMVSRNIKDSYRMGVELTADWQPFDGFRWCMNATWSKNRAKDMQLTVIDRNTWALSTVNVGETTLSFSPSLIVNSTLSYEWKGLKATLFSKYVSDQYMTNSGFKSYIDEDNNNREVSAMIDAFFINDFDLSYTFKLRSMKSITAGVTIYNLGNVKYESNGSCGMNFAQASDGSIYAFHNSADWFYSWATFSAQAPTHFLAHLSLNF